MEVALIQVPYMIGDERHGASKGPARYLDAGLERLLGDAGVASSVVRIDRTESFRDSASASRVVNTKVQKAVRNAIGLRQLPLILAGSCDVSMGVLAAFDHSRCGVVWIDAHADFNTPESTVSGFFAGMSLAVISGHCYRSLWAEIGDSTPVPQAAIVLLGLRDLSPAAERERLTASSIRVVGWRDGKPDRDVDQVLDERGEVLTGDAQHAGVRHCADRGRPSSVAQQRELAEIVTGVQPANRPFPAVDLLQHLDFSGGDDVEPSAQLALAHDVLAGAESHRDHRIAPADWQRRQLVREHGGSHPVQHQGEPAPPGGHE